MVDFVCWKYSGSNSYQKLWTIVCIILLQLICLTPVDAQCKDQSLCSFMASEGECENDPDYMLQECPKACKNPCLCPGISQDTACDCLAKAKNGYCDDPGAMTDCQSTCTQVIHESCPLLPVPSDPNARLSTWSANYLTTVTEVCVPGYAPVEPDNQGKKTCSSGQKWADDPYNGTPVECTPVDCGPPPTAPNAFSGPTDTAFGSKADYTCSRGYIQVQGQKTLTCNASSLWEGDIIVCKKPDCGQPPSSPNAAFKVTNSTSGQTATYTCSVGFKRTQGDATLRCSSTGVWQGSLIVCTVIDCGRPPSPSNSEVTVKDTTYGKSATYTCMDGYTQVQGQTVLTCNASGAWGIESPVCDKVICGLPPASPNANVAVSNTNYGDTANYTCTQGYAYDEGDIILTCGSTGTWGGVLISCIKVICGLPPAAPNANVAVSNTSYGDTANYTCTQGYAYDEGDMILTCGSTGAWEGVLISCIKIICGLPPAASNANVAVGNTSYGDTANYTCTQGYAYDEGDMILTCGPTGAWEGVLISCIKVICGLPPAAPNANVAVSNTSYGDTANYTCTQGYAYDEGDMILTCGSTGAWEGVLISCIKVFCALPPAAPNAHVAVSNTSYGDTANYTCTQGYAYDEGDMILTCGSTGAWEGVLISCIKVICGPPPAASNANVAVSNTSYGDTANYTCTQGYAYDEGDMILTCASKGTWEGVLISCIRIDCGPAPPASNANLSVNGTLLGDTAGYTCGQGYEQVNGNSTLTCGATGDWQGVVITCQRVSCGKPVNATNANAISSGSLYGDTATYSCLPGHTYAYGDRILKCDASGKWVGVPITCQIVDCANLSTPLHTLVQQLGTLYGHSANYSCQAGYIGVSGNRTRVCSASGQWSGTPLVCSTIDCGDPPKLAYTDVQVSGTTYNQTANYSCQIGYQYQQGQPNMVCGLSGNWTGNALKCKIINCGPPPKGKNLVMTYTSTTFGNRVSYSCSARYKYSSGDRNMTCNQTGNWSGQLMTCVEKDCGFPNVHNLSDVKFTSITYGSQAVYTCRVGSERVDGDFKRTCQDNETWSGRPVTCGSFVCGPAPVFEDTRQWTLPGEGHLQYQDKSHYECLNEEEGREGLQWVLECGPNKVWVGDKPQCGANSGEKLPTSSHKTLDAPAAWAIGIAIFAVLATVTVLCIVLDCGALRKHSKCMRKDVKNLRKDVANSLSNFRVMTKWQPGSANEGRLIPNSPSVMASTSPSSSIMSFQTKDFHSGESLAKSSNLQSTHLTVSNSQSQLFPPSVSPMTPRSSLSIPKSPSGITLSSLSETTLRNPMPDVGS